MFMSSGPRAVFLLGVSTLCYYVQLGKSRPDVSLDQHTGARIQDVLRNTYPVWLYSSTVTGEAQRAVEHLSLMLGLREGRQSGAPEGAVLSLTPAGIEPS